MDNAKCLSVVLTKREEEIISPTDFIKEIINQYHLARIPFYPKDKIYRGRSRSISPLAEDLFAKYLAENDDTIEKIYVDQSIVIENDTKRFIPDIVIIKNNEITTFIDLKMDLGYKRDGLIELCKKDGYLLDIVRGKNCQLIEGRNKTKVNYKISNKAIYDIVIISDQNISKIILDNQIEGAKRFENNVKAHVLSRKKHPNSYGLNREELLTKIDVKVDAFKEILVRIR